jgi:hypothetical protein
VRNQFAQQRAGSREPQEEIEGKLQELDRWAGEELERKMCEWGMCEWGVSTIDGWQELQLLEREARDREWEMRAPKMDIWKKILEWAKCKREDLGRRKLENGVRNYERERKKQEHGLAKQKHATVMYGHKRRLWQRPSHIRHTVSILEDDSESQALEDESRVLEQKSQALEEMLQWMAGSGMRALERAEKMLRERGIKPKNIEECFEQLLRVILIQEERDCLCQHLTSSADSGASPLCCRRKQIFTEMLKEVPNLSPVREHLNHP